MPDVRELGQKVKAKYPGVYDNIDDAELGRRVKAKYPGSYDQFTDAPAQPQQGPGFLDSVAIGGQRFLRKVGDTAQAAGELVTSTLSGDFRPAKELAELAGRGAAGIFLGGNPGYGGAARINEMAMSNVNAQRAARREAGPDSGYWRRSQADIARLDELASRDPSLTGKIVRGGVALGGEALVAGLSGGGSIPATMAGGAVMSLNEPENLPLSAALGALGGGGARIARAVAAERTLGRGAAQAAESGAQQVLPGFERAVAEAAGQVEKSVARKVVENTAALYHVPRALMASADASAPLRQSAIFTISNPTMAARAGIEMFRAFKSRNFERIAVEIAQDADAALGQRFGLHLGSQAKEGLKKAEEAFISKFAGKIPIVKQSEQAYTTYLDVMRVQKFKQYKALIDEAGLSQAQTRDAYAKAATWINYATGRGDFGQTVEKMMPLLNSFMFAPKYAMSRFNILNPVYYAKNAATQEGRIILKQQAKELFTFASVVGSTMALARAAGADVTLNPNSPDFGKIKAGNYRFDLGAGTVQAVRLVYRTGADLARMVRGDKAERGKTSVDVGGRYLRSKLAPVPSWFVDAALGRTYVGKDYSTASALRDRVLPIMWNDWIDAAWQDGIGGVLKVTPGAFGVGVERHDAQESQQLRRR